MQRDILFSAKKFSVQFLPQSAEFFVVRWGELFSSVQKLAERLESLKPFLSGMNGDSLLVCGVRNNFDSESESIDAAFDVVETLVAPYSFLTQETYPEISDVVLVREESSDDVYPRVFQKSRWMRWKPKDAPANEVAEKQSKTISNFLLDYFSYAFSKESAEQTALVEQLQVSMNMLRCGLLARSTSAEFICKFIALEGLVCGESHHDSRTALLESRLSALCGKALPNVNDLVSKLSKRRNAAFHHARINRPVILSYMETFDRLILAAFVFAVAHLNKANSVEQLWTLHLKYELPDFVFERAPGEELRAAILHGVLDPHLVWRGIGKFVDALYYNAPNADSNLEPPRLSS